MKVRNVLEGTGAALLLLIPYYKTFLNTSNITLYHHKLPVNNLVGGLIVDLLAVAFLTAGFLFAAEHLPRLIQRVLYTLFAALMFWNIISSVIGELQVHAPVNIAYLFAYWDSVWRGSCVAILLLSGVLAYFLPRFALPLVRFIRLALAGFAFSAAWIVPQLLHVALAQHPDESLATLRPSTSASGISGPRIVWILFDELSYDQTFDHPFPGIKLPSFDNLRSESVTFSNLKPVGLYTDRVIPSLLLGQRIDQIRSTIDGALWYRDESQGRWRPYDPGSTLFGLAQRHGWNSGIDGTFNPYCRLFAPTLYTCAWEPIVLPMEAYGASEEKSVVTNAAALPKMILAELTGSAIMPANLHIQDYRDVMERTRTLIENGQVRFVFIHLSIPHPGGIYDREHHMLRPSGTYLDNLVMADDTLEALLQEINATPSASRTTVVVSSDHSWRIPLWRDTEFWSEEEQRASRGHFDERPVLLIHFPGQTSGNDVNFALPELLEHDIIAGMLQGQIKSPKDLAGLLSQYIR